MIKKTIRMIVLVSLVYSGVMAQVGGGGLGISDVSIYGSLLETYSKKVNRFDVKEIEISIQEYVHPIIKADISIALHKGIGGQRYMELSEGYISISDLKQILFPYLNSNLMIEAILGQKLLNIGNLNARHSDQWKFADKPLALKKLLGTEHGLTAEGGGFAYNRPFPLITKIEGGFWRPKEDKHPISSSSAGQSIVYNNQLLTSRLTSRIEWPKTLRWDLGMSYMLDNAKENNQKQYVVGVDIRSVYEWDKGQFLTLETELYHANYISKTVQRGAQWGGFVSGVYPLNARYEVGMRYSYLGPHGDEGEHKDEWSAVVNQTLNKATTLRMQYTLDENNESVLISQFVFAI